MKEKIRAVLRNHFINLRGIRTDKKIVVIESDDWGAVRSPSSGVIKELKKQGFNTEKSHYMQNDSLASEADLEKLFSTLKCVKDHKGDFPIITANTILANPDFEKIETNGFDEYHFEWFTETLKKYPEHSNSFDLWSLGIKDGYFYPQLHGREHLQVQRWLRDLKAGNHATKTAFGMGYCGLDPVHSDEIELSYLPAYDYQYSDELGFISKSIREASSKFEELFGYKSKSFVAPNYIWNQEIEKILYSCEIKYIQSGRVQFFPEIESKNKKYIRHYTGEKNRLGQIYSVRNCSFEPSSDRRVNWVAKCINEIRTAFLWKKPAVIESHRVNYVGFINEENREISLKLLRMLLAKIVEEWPEVEFLSSDQLGNFIDNSYT